MSYQTITNLSLDSQNLSVNLVNNQTNQFSLYEISAGSKNSPFMDMLNSRTQELFSQKNDDAFGFSAGFVNHNAVSGGISSGIGETAATEDCYKSADSELNNTRNEKTDSFSDNEVNKNNREKEINKKTDSEKTVDEKNVESQTDCEKNRYLNENDDNKVSEDEKKSEKDLKNGRHSLDFNKINQIEEGDSFVSGQNVLHGFAGDEAQKSGIKADVQNVASIQNLKNAKNSKIDKNGIIVDGDTQNQEVLAEKILQDGKNISDANVKELLNAKNQGNFAKERMNSGDLNENDESDFADLLNNRLTSDSIAEGGMPQKNDVRGGKITVQDLRSESEKQNALLQAENGKNNHNDLRISNVQVSSDGTNFINMEMNQTVNADVLSLNNQTAGANGSNFQSMLNNQIQSNISEFVKAGNIILKDNDQGQINLILHPDDLGNVKIHLSLDGKNISGQIIVSSKEALQVFKDNAETMREAFIKNGFDGASFDVAYNNSGSQSGNNSAFEQNDGTGIIARKMYSNAHESSGTAFDDDGVNKEIEKYSNYSVNIVA